MIRRWVERPHRLVLAALALASLARFVHVTYLGDDLGGPDSNTYDQGGWDMATRGPFSDRVEGLPYFPPGYTFLVAFHYRLFGRHPYAVKLTQIVMIAGLTWVVWLLAGRVVGERAALITGLGMSASLAWLALPHPLMYEPWLALCLAGALLLLLIHDETGGLWPACAAGALLGAACVFQDKHFTLLPLLAVWLLVGRRRLGAVVLIGAAVAVVLPVTLRNVAVYDQPIVVATNHGINLYIGNNPDATGGFANPENPPRHCPEAGDRTLDASEIDATLTRCALRLAAGHAGHEVRIVPNKLARFWATYVGPWAEQNNWRHHFDWRKMVPPRLRTSTWFDRIDSVGSTIWILGGMALMVVGFLEQRSRRAWLIAITIVWLTATHVVTFGDPRYRVPLLPLVWMFTAAGAVRAVRAVTDGRAVTRAPPPGR